MFFEPAELLIRVCGPSAVLQKRLFEDSPEQLQRSIVENLHAFFFGLPCHIPCTIADEPIHRPTAIERHDAGDMPLPRNELVIHHRKIERIELSAAAT